MSLGINRTLFITPEFLCKNSVINSNVEQNILRKCISTAEDKYIHPLLGTQLTLSLTNHINNYVLSGTTIPTNYKTLLDDYIVPTLIEYSTYQLVPFSYKFRNKGISRQSSPDSIPADQDELIFVRNNILNDAQFYATRLTQYLRTNNNQFPEYYILESGDIKPAKGGYSSSVFIPGGNRGNYFGGCDGCGLDGYGIGYPINI